MRRKIYVCGDSFTVGDELIDHQMEGWPGPRLHSDPLPAVTWFKNPQRTVEINRLWGNYGQYMAACKQVCWAAQLGELVGADVQNSANSGNSMLAVLSQVQRDLVSARVNGIEYERVIVQVTGPYRTSVFNVKRKHVDAVNLHAGIEPFWASAAQKTYLDGWSRSEHDESMHYRWLLLANAIQDTVQSLTQRPPLWLDSVFMNGELLDTFEGHLQNDEVISLWKRLGGRQMIEPQDSMSYYQNNQLDLVMPNFHFSPTIHSRFARAVAHRHFGVQTE